jgi:hypothetical protein
MIDRTGGHSGECCMFRTFHEHFLPVEYRPGYWVLLTPGEGGRFRFSHRGWGGARLRPLLVAFLKSFHRANSAAIGSRFPQL